MSENATERSPGAVSTPPEESNAKQKAEKIPDLHREDPLMTQQKQETGSVTPDPS